MGILPILIQKFPSNNYQVILKTVWEWCGDDWSESDQGKPENLKQEGSIPRLSGPISSPKGGGKKNPCGAVLGTTLLGAAAVLTTMPIGVMQQL
jgi:hypothetical protein